MQHQKHSIALIGLSGVGKSTVAHLLAAALGWPWVDTDALIVQRVGCSIADIFARAGEDYFRTLETETLRSVLATSPTSPCVLATGGGIVLCEENRALLCTYAYIVWMDAPTTILLARLTAHDEQRPLLAGHNAASRLEALRAARQSLYQSLANQYINTAELEPSQTVEAIVAGYRRCFGAGE